MDGTHSWDNPPNTGEEKEREKERERKRERGRERDKERERGEMCYYSDIK